MAICPFVAKGVFYSGSQDFDSASFDLGSAAGRVVIASFTIPDSQTVTEARIGAAGTLLDVVATSVFGSGAYARQYIVAGVVSETGSQFVRIKTTGSGGTRYGFAASYSGAASVRGGASSGNNADPNANPSLSVTTVDGDTVVLIGHDGERATTFTSATGGTTRETAGSYIQDQLATATGTTTTGGTLSVPGFWQAGAAVLVPISSGAEITGSATLDGLSASGSMEPQPQSDLTGSATLDGLSASGSMAPQPPSELTGSATLDGLSAAGSMAMAPGTLTVPELRNWAGMLLVNQLVENVVVIRMSDRSLLCAFTNQTTHGTTGNLALSHASLTAGTLCMVVGYSPDGSARFARPVTVV